MTLPIADILDAAREGHEAVKVLCAGLTGDQLRAEIERICDLNPHIHSNGYWTKHQARGALEAELVRRAATPEPT